MLEDDVVVVLQGVFGVLLVVRVVVLAKEAAVGGPEGELVSGHQLLVTHDAPGGQKGTNDGDQASRKKVANARFKKGRT